MTAAATQAAWRQRRLDAGLCTRCGVNPHDPERVTCAPCRATHAAGQNPNRKRGDPTKHRAVNAQRERKRRRERLKAGLCQRCGKRKPVPGYNACLPCKKQSWASGIKSRERKGELSYDGISGRIDRTFQPTNDRNSEAERELAATRGES